MIIGEHLRAIRQQMKLSLRDIERRTGLRSSNVSRMESNRIVPTLETLEKLAKGLRIPFYRLFCNGDGDPQAQPRNGRSESWSPQEEARFLNELLRLFDQIDDSGRRLLLSTACEMARRKSTGRKRT